MIIFIMLLEKFNNKIDESNIKTFMKTLKKLEDEQHQKFLEEFEKKMENIDKQKKFEEQERLRILRDLDE